MATKYWDTDGTANMFVLDFIAKTDQHCKVYLYKYNEEGVDGDVDSTTGLYIRTADTPTIDDVVTLDGWALVDNIISFYEAPVSGGRLAVEVAPTVEELGEVLIDSEAQKVMDELQAYIDPKVVEVNQAATDAEYWASIANDIASDVTALDDYIGGEVTEVLNG